MSVIGIKLRDDVTFDTAAGRLVRHIQKNCPIGAYVVLRYWEETDEKRWDFVDTEKEFPRRQIVCRFHYVAVPETPQFGEVPSCNVADSFKP
jgi:hypothetical protein